ncbi:hypothetical protein [Nostoc sp.]
MTRRGSIAGKPSLCVLSISLSPEVEAQSEKAAQEGQDVIPILDEDAP